MASSPRLMYYDTGAWRYDGPLGERVRELPINIGKVVATQGENESRKDFFKRVNDMPKPNMYGSKKKRDKFVSSNNPEDRLKAAEHGYGLDVLINDEDTLVREAVARQKYGLDKLVNDIQWSVRREVAKQGYGLGILVNDKSSAVRQEVAKQGYGLDKLVCDEWWDVRNAVNQTLDGRTVVEWWESAPKKKRYYKNMKSMPKDLQTTFAIIAADRALGGERVAECELWGGYGYICTEKVVLDVTHSYSNGFSIETRRSPSDNEYTVAFGVSSAYTTTFKDIEELLQTLRSIKSLAAKAGEESEQALSKAIIAVESLLN